MQTSRQRANGCQTVTLTGGRRLAFTVTGPDDGVPVIYCHGAIGTSLDATIDLQRITRRLGVRYIAPSRPGIGASDPSPGRTVLDFADDIRELADALSLNRFAVVGVSAGGPYALALAYKLRGRVGRVAICSSLSPLGPPHATPGVNTPVRLALGLLARRPGLCRAIGDAVLPAVAHQPQLISRMIRANAAPGERKRLSAGGERTAVSDSFLDATSAGVGGLVDDYLTYAAGWNFPLGEVYNEVHLWHGARDPLVPVEHALQLAASLPRCQVLIDPDEGHHFFRSSLPEILAELINCRPRQVAASAPVHPSAESVNQ